jgi:sulfite reductase (NADPH) flavoprotein alpha-component
MPLKSENIADMESLAAPIQIIYATTTGNSQTLAEEAAERLESAGISITVSDMDDFSAEAFYKIQTLLAIVSTDASGDPPISGISLFKYLRSKTAADLGHLFYSVLALGDSYYDSTFCQAGKDFDRILEELGAHRFLKRRDCDIFFWDDFEMWLKNVISAIYKKRKPTYI